MYESLRLLVTTATDQAWDDYHWASTDKGRRVLGHAYELLAEVRDTLNREYAVGG